MPDWIRHLVYAQRSATWAERLEDLGMVILIGGVWYLILQLPLR